MASGGPFKELCEEVTCSICLEYFKDPVILDCGHNFCQACLTQHWGGLGTTAFCPQCQEMHQRKNLRPNHQLANVAEQIGKLWEGERAESGRQQMCPRPWEPLKLFCKDDQAPVCVVCNSSMEHQGHNVLPMEEATQECKGKNQAQLKSLEEEREKFKEQKLTNDQGTQKCLLLGRSMEGAEVAQAMAAELQVLQDQVAQLQADNAALQAAALAPAPAPGPPPPVPPRSKCPVQPPAKFDGNWEQFPTFQAQVELYMRLRPEDFPNDQVRVWFVISLLTGLAGKWATTRLLANDPLLTNYQGFIAAMGELFGDVLRQETATREIQRLKQGKGSVADYTTRFQLLMHDLNWNDAAYTAQYLEGLQDEILDALVQFDRPRNLTCLIHRCLQIDSRLEERRLEHRAGGLHSPPVPAPFVPPCCFTSHSHPAPQT